jgi:hypothetical protein
MEPGQGECKAGKKTPEYNDDENDKCLKPAD